MSRAGRICRFPKCVEPVAHLRLLSGSLKYAKDCPAHLEPKLRVLLADKAGLDPAHSARGDVDPNLLHSTDLTHSELPWEHCGAWMPKKGRRCTRPAGAGTAHSGRGACKLHGGSTPNANVSAARAEAHEKAVVMGLPVDVDPLDALLHCIRITAGEVQYATIRIYELGEGDAVVHAMERTKRKGNGESFVETRKSTDANLNVWIRVRQEAVAQLARYSKMAIDAGIAERQVQVAESMGTVFGSFIQRVLDALELSDEQRELAPGIVSQELKAIDVVGTVS